jgi:Protein of unknown function (DUF3830)
MDKLRIISGSYRFDARFETEAAPKTVAVFKKILPYENKVIHVRWSGEAVWIPLGEHDFGLTYENHTSYPAPGQMIVYPGGVSETEILLAYGGVRFASKWANWQAIILLRLHPTSVASPSFANPCCGRARRRFVSRRSKGRLT